MTAGGSGPTAALTVVVVALAGIGRSGAIARTTAAARTETVVVVGAAVALLADHVGQALTVTAAVVAHLRSALFAMARLAVLGRHGVSEEAGSAQAAGVAEGVVQTAQALAAHRVARQRIADVDVVRTVAWFAVVALNVRSAEEAGCARLAHGSFTVQRRTRGNQNVPRVPFVRDAKLRPFASFLEMNIYRT